MEKCYNVSLIGRVQDIGFRNLIDVGVEVLKTIKGDTSELVIEMREHNKEVASFNQEMREHNRRMDEHNQRMDEHNEQLKKILQKLIER